MEKWGTALYGDPCSECGFDWSVSAVGAITYVERLPERLAKVTAGLRGNEHAPSGGWSVTEYVSHIGDNLWAWAERVQGARLTGQRRVSGYDPDTLAVARNYQALPLPAALWSVTISAREWVHVLNQAVLERVELHHDSRGVQLADDIARNNAHDAHHHVWDIHQIRAAEPLA